MDTEVKRKWIEALRSGDFKQWRGALVATDGHDRWLCCLGVGFCIAKPDKDVGASWTDEAAEAIGLTVEQREILVSMNDSEKRSFAEIADYIEANL
jgi:hypothetical protein